jgi:hypothetical protein
LARSATAVENDVLDLSFQTNLLLIRQWLAYSGQRPLSICLTWGQWPPDGVELETEDAEEIFADVVAVVAHFSN